MASSCCYIRTDTHAQPGDRRCTGNVRQETSDRKETGEVSQTGDIRDRRREVVVMRQGTGDVRQGTEEGRQETDRRHTTARK